MPYSQVASALRKLAVACGLAALGLSLQGCGRSVDITARPPEAASQQTAESEPAAVSIEAPADTSRLSEDLARQLPGDIAVISRRVVHAVCSSVNGKQQCLDARLSGRIFREGAIGVAGTGRGFDLTLPLRYELVAQPIGTGPSTPVSGKLAVTASFAVTLDERWQPALRLEPVFKWDSGTKLAVLSGETDVRADIEPMLTQHWQKLPAAMAAPLLSADLRPEVEMTWRYLHYPLALSAEQQIWLRGTPLGLRFGGLAQRDGAMRSRVSILVRFQTFVGERPAPLPPSPLPAPAAGPGGGPDNSGGGILLPQDIAYEAMAASVAGALPAIPARDPRGEAAAGGPYVKSITFYAAGKRLAVAVNLGGLPGGSWFSGSGQAYFLATPAMKPGTARLVLEPAELYTSHPKPSALQRDLPFLEDQRFAANVSAALNLDVSDKLASALNALKKQGSLPLAQGLKLFFGPTQSRVARLYPGIDSLRLDVEVSGDLVVRREGTDIAADAGGAVKATP